MPSIRDIHRRIRSISNTRQITRAMEAVSATKMRRSQEYALRARPFAVKALELLMRLAEQGRDLRHPLLEAPATYNKNLLVLVSTDKGLCGGLNSGVIGLLRKIPLPAAGREYLIIGKRGIGMARRQGINPLFTYTNFGDFFDLAQTEALAELILGFYIKKRFDSVWILYTNFRSTLRQEPAARQVLPLQRETITEIVQGILPEYGRYADKGKKVVTAQKRAFSYTFEPNAEEILKDLLPSLVKTAIHHIILEANASEHSARMIAMKNASENARDILKELRLEFNKARQAAITREIAEITAGAA